MTIQKHTKASLNEMGTPHIVCLNVFELNQSMPLIELPDRHGAQPTFQAPRAGLAVLRDDVVFMFEKSVWRSAFASKQD